MVTMLQSKHVHQKRTNRIKIIARPVDTNFQFCYNIDMLSSKAQHFLKLVRQL